MSCDGLRYLLFGRLWAGNCRRPNAPSTTLIVSEFEAQGRTAHQRTPIVKVTEIIDAYKQARISLTANIAACSIACSSLSHIVSVRDDDSFNSSGNSRVRNEASWNIPLPWMLEGAHRPEYPTRCSTMLSLLLEKCTLLCLFAKGTTNIGSGMYSVIAAHALWPANKSSTCVECSSI